jgi:hypothetical protein
MTREEIFRAWAPDESPWSAWVKPVLFAYLDDAVSLRLVDLAVSWAPPADGVTAIVVDVPGVSGVSLGVALARRGYRPVPLYNSCPSPVGSAAESLAIVDARSIMGALTAGTTALTSCALAAGAPPAFLLDADRRRPVAPEVLRDSFDNRSISLPTDFPSSALLLSRGVRKVLLVQENDHEPQVDLAHTLLRWQKAGLTLVAVSLVRPDALQPITVSEPPLFRRMWYGLLATAGLRRSPLGGFGG